MSEFCLIIDSNFYVKKNSSNKSRKINNVIRRQERKYNLQTNKRLIAEANKTTDQWKSKSELLPMFFKRIALLSTVNFIFLN